MKIHPLKIVSLISLLILTISQFALMLWVETDYRVMLACGLAVPLLLPVKGMVSDNRYTYKWVGFLTMLYFMIGVSESFSNPELRLYSILTIVFSALLFISAIYYSRYLRQR